jgi:hypothetical protein|nr:MAG TPA: hypothetical protein [Inoviridae sp.]
MTEYYVNCAFYAFFIGIGAGLIIGISIAAFKWLFGIISKFF